MAKLGKWKCPKCGSEDYKLEELMMTVRHAHAVSDLNPFGF